ncbi:outer membrane beta-barrel protein [Piscirickettsia litoralis]|uniref:Outer membrane protein beta-barrel domain-containing protein n=1 Tax=Piscirickettsia litoralis TaxID=1891921 RepID=A0ABX3A2K8_9GAMM|nr:outer membrane beta-barrel protein [Piscirickettsia litoralis]ODN43106.1 hypothetical protein BGC07_09490 [Piscirickettsia litoralis]
MKKIVLCLLAAGLLSSAYAQNQPKSELPKSGLYLGIGFGKANTHTNYNEVIGNDPLGQAIGDALASVFKTSAKLFVGYKFNPYIALEGSYADYYDDDTEISGVGKSSEHVYGLGLSAKLSYPVAYWFSPYARLGVDWVSRKKYS